MTHSKWRRDTARSLEEAAQALLDGHDYAAGTAFGAATGYLLIAARGGDPDAARVLAGLRESTNPNEPTRRLEFEPDTGWIVPEQDE
jgi:hypothetical protein